MPTAAFATLGCKVNQYETQRILDDFEARGFRIAAFNQPADIYVINTCSVTQAAERKSRYMVRKLARQNPDAIVVMTGCYAEMAKIKDEEIDEAALIVPNHQKMETLAHLLAAYPDLNRALEADLQLPAQRTVGLKTRATLKVQDGCDVFCTFCSIPYTRKVMRSRPLVDIVAEAERYVREGCREIVVTGVLVGAYGQEPGFTGPIHHEKDHPPYSIGPLLGPSPKRGQWLPDRAYQRPDLADLLMRLAEIEGLARVRLSSIEPTQITDRLLDAFASEPKLCRHLHIPLQSGDTGILKAMNRPYDQSFYLDRCLAAQRRMPDVAITSDIMVAFPGEDRAAFENTLTVARKVGFARAHLFRYSPRPNTPAAALRSQVPEEEKEARSKELGDLCRGLQQKFIQRWLGLEMEVLVEGREQAAREAVDTAGGDSGNADHPRIASEHPGTSASPLRSGYTSNYLRVQFAGPSHLVGKLVRVRLLEPTPDGAVGEAGGAPFGPEEAPPDADFIPLASLSASLVKT